MSEPAPGALPSQRSHDGCNYLAPLFFTGRKPMAWFCNKLRVGRIGRAFHPGAPAMSGTERPHDSNICDCPSCLAALRTEREEARALLRGVLDSHNSRTLTFSINEIRAFLARTDTGGQE